MSKTSTSIAISFVGYFAHVAHAMGRLPLSDSEFDTATDLLCSGLEGMAPLPHMPMDMVLHLHNLRNRALKGGQTARAARLQAILDSASRPAPKPAPCAAPAS